MSEDNHITETPEQKFNRLVETVKQSIGLDTINQRMDEQAKMLDSVIKELGNTNTTLSKIIPHVNRWIAIENGQTTTEPQQQASQNTAKEVASQLATMPREARMQMIKDVGQGISETLKGLAEAYRTIKGQPADNGLGINDDWLKQEASSILKESIELTHDINSSVKKALTGKAARNAMLSTLNEPVHTI